MAGKLATISRVALELEVSLYFVFTEFGTPRNGQGSTLINTEDFKAHKEILTDWTAG
jgi:hypothetical protein